MKMSAEIRILRGWTQSWFIQKKRIILKSRTFEENLSIFKNVLQMFVQTPENLQQAIKILFMSELENFIFVQHSPLSIQPPTSTCHISTLFLCFCAHVNPFMFVSSLTEAFFF